MMTKSALVMIAAVLAMSARGDRVLADGAPTYDLGKRETWKVGDIVTETIGENEVQGYTFPVPGSPTPKAQTRSSKTSVGMLRKCLEVDAEGGLQKALVFIRTWSFDNGHGADTSLEGAFVETKGRGNARTWRVVFAPSPPSEAAKVWLEGAFGAKRPESESVRRMWLPKAPVAVGDTWIADLAPFLEARFADTPIDRAATTSRVRLASVEGQTAKIACEAKIPLLGVPMKKGSEPMPWKKGGVLALTGEVTVKVEARLGGGAATRYVLEGDAEKDGKSFGVVIQSERHQETQVGGVMPDLPKSVVPEAPTPPPAMDPVPR